MQNDVRQFFNDKAEIWDSKETRDENWLRDFFAKHIPITNGMRILDLGCGTGIVSNILFDMSQKKVVALDLSDTMIELAKAKHNQKNIDFYCEDFYRTTKTGFDMIVCFNAYPHFCDVFQFKEQTKKCLTSSGYLVVLHNLSRDTLSRCHQGLSANISRDLKEVKKEVEIYKDDFNIVKLIDNDEMYMMILQKRKGDLQ